MNIIEDIVAKEYLHDNMIMRIIDEILLRKKFSYGYKMIIDYIK